MRGERIEWEEIARWRTRLPPDNSHFYVEFWELDAVRRLLAALEAGGGMAATVKRVAAALDLVPHSRQAAMVVALDLAVKDWRRCVAPRGGAPGGGAR